MSNCFRIALMYVYIIVNIISVWQKKGKKRPGKYVCGNREFLYTVKCINDALVIVY